MNRIGWMGKSPRCHLGERRPHEGSSERSDCLHGRIRYLRRRRGVDHDKTGAHRGIVDLADLATDQAELVDRTWVRVKPRSCHDQSWSERLTRDCLHGTLFYLPFEFESLRVASHSVTASTLSTCTAFFMSASRSLPGGIRRAVVRALSAYRSRRISKDSAGRDLFRFFFCISCIRLIGKAAC